MGRRIITRQFQSKDGAAADTYFDRVVKYIPADINAAWIFVSGLIKDNRSVPQDKLLWGAFLLGTALTAMWTFKQTRTSPAQKFKHPATTQILVSTGAFIVWVFALGEPFSRLPWYNSLYGSLLLVFYTLVVALITPSEN
jgi:hypothetical protein